MPIPTNLGRRMASRRRDLGWTQQELAAASGVPRSWISLVETGGRAGPRADELERVARALGVTMAYLLHGERPAQTLPIDAPAVCAGCGAGRDGCGRAAGAGRRGGAAQRADGARGLVIFLRPFIERQINDIFRESRIFPRHRCANFRVEFTERWANGDGRGVLVTDDGKRDDGWVVRRYRLYRECLLLVAPCNRYSVRTSQVIE
jgi:transcriptional regulator with XRE-family HTH domain